MSFSLGDVGETEQHSSIVALDSGVGTTSMGTGGGVGATLNLVGSCCISGADGMGSSCNGAIGRNDERDGIGYSGKLWNFDLNLYIFSLSSLLDCGNDCGYGCGLIFGTGEG